MKLSECFNKEQIVQDQEFTQLDSSDSSLKNTLVYCGFLDNLNHANKNDNISCVITTPQLKDKVSKDKGIVISSNPRFSFFKLYNDFYTHNKMTNDMVFGLGTNCIIHPSAIISKSSRIGDNVEIGANVVIEANSIIGDNCYIGSNTTVGAHGLVTVSEGENKLFVRHAGGVEIEHNAILLSNCVIARSLFQEFTRIGYNTHIGILANIGHGAKVGNNCVISGNSVVAGRSVIGNHVQIGVSTSIAQNIKVGDHAEIKMGSAVIKDVKEKEVISGNFALAHSKNFRDYINRRKA